MLQLFCNVTSRRNQMVFKGFKNKQQQLDAVVEDGMRSVAVTIVKDAPAEKKPIVRNQMVYKNKQRRIDEAALQAQAQLVKP
jgi:acid stress-induced BolA-like protein IbaG/YrbA